MTLADSPNKVRLSGDGITTSFPFSFPLIQNDYSDLYVYKIDIDPLTLNETNTLLVLSTDYTITPVKDLNNRITGGSIEITSFIPSVDQDIFAIREQDFEQELELKNNQSFPEKAVEETFDKLMAIEQQQAEEINRSVKVNKFYTGAADLTLPFPVGGEVVGYSADGLSMTTYALTDIPTIAASTLGATFVQLTTEEAMRDLLLLGTTDNVEFATITGTVITGSSYVGLPIASNAEVKAGTDSSKIVVPSSLLSLFSASTLATNSCVNLPINIGGAFVEVIIQFGKEEVTAGATNVVTLPCTYPNGHLIAVSTFNEVTNVINEPCLAQTTSTSTISVTNSAGTTYTINWLSIGF